MLCNVIIGTIPVGVFGLTLHFMKFSDMICHNTYIAGTGFLITSCILFSIKSKEKLSKNTITLDALPFKTAFIIGCFQAFAILPGVSRSGSTISSALKFNVSREDAGTFSFLLAIPAIMGASCVETLSSLLHASETNTQPIDWTLICVGFIVSAIVGFISLNILLKVIRNGSLRGYAYYCLILGLLILAYRTFKINPLEMF